MSTIAYSNHDVPARTDSAASAKSLWKKLYERMLAAQQKRAERSVANYLASHGGLITDEMEREIMVRLSANGSFRRPR